MDDEAAPVIDSFASVGDVFGGPLVTSFLDAAVAVFEGAGGCRGKRLATDDSRFPLHTYTVKSPTSQRCYL
jgi:hypothetical protein